MHEDAASLDQDSYSMGQDFSFIRHFAR